MHAPMVIPPWSADQVEALNAWQRLGYVHEFTCPHEHGALIATTDGWRCPKCTYIQNWAHEAMADKSRHPRHPFKE